MYSGLDKDGHVYLELQKGNKEQAEMYLLEIEKENGALNEFQTCYMGLARNDKSLIEKSYMMFCKRRVFSMQIYLNYTWVIFKKWYNYLYRKRWIY